MDLPIKLGVVGGRRGSSLIRVLTAMSDVAVVAVCDTNPDVLAEIKVKYDIPYLYAEYEALLQTDLDAVIIATPVEFHVAQSVAALEAGKHVLCEVPAATSIEECRQLVEAVEKSGRVYMMAENYCYMRNNVLIGEMVKRGFFGDLYYGIGEYIHELKELNERNPWRRKHQTGRNGNTYPTHSIGPLLQWMQDTVEWVCCLGSGHHYKDSKGEIYANEDTTTTLCKLSGGGMLQLRLDMLSNRPHNMAYYSLQGVKGCYEAGRGMGDRAKVWLADFSPDKDTWQPLGDFLEYLPEIRRNPPPEAQGSGHGGSDYWCLRDFIDTIIQGKEPPISVYDAVEWTAVGLCSTASIAKRGTPVDVPKFRDGQ
ncbi:MAG TPA: Gfo/Idh/MocA family oxidoreductase [Firmicutes bacterium]|jgi:predicted dehydrogenase|nr:Gfo/Idh/MocA family oxidoreductase [Bacillota bacterium]